MFYVEHADTFSYEYTVLAKCDTREEAQHIRDWYHSQQRDHTMSEYHVVDDVSRRGGLYQGMLEYCARERERKGYNPLVVNP